MIVKVFEVRDSATFMPVVAIKVTPANEAERYLAARLGYGTTPEAQSKYVLMSLLCSGEPMFYDPHHWSFSSRTRAVAHEYIKEHFDELESGAVVDVQFILRETEAPKVSEALTTSYG